MRGLCLSLILIWITYISLWIAEHHPERVTERVELGMQAMIAAAAFAAILCIALGV